MSHSDDDIKLSQFKSALAEHDEAFAWGTIAQYAEMIGQLPQDELRCFAVRAAMFTTVFAIDAGRHHPVTDDVLKHLVLELQPRCSGTEMAYDCGNEAYGVPGKNGMH